MTETEVLVTPVTPDVYWPTDDWRSAAPEEQGLDPAQLGRMFSAIDDQQLNVHGVLIVRNGYIVAENYYSPYQQDTKHRVYSVTKSVISALVGIAIAEGYIDGVDGRVLDFFPERTFANQFVVLTHQLCKDGTLKTQQKIHDRDSYASLRSFPQQYAWHASSSCE